MKWEKFYLNIKKLIKFSIIFKKYVNLKNFIVDEMKFIKIIKINL